MEGSSVSQPTLPDTSPLLNPGQTVASSETAADGTSSDPALPLPDPQEREVSKAEAPARPSHLPSDLNQALARLEMNSLQVRLYLDAIEEKISRMEPRLEQMQPAPQPAPQPIAGPAQADTTPAAADLPREARAVVPSISESTTDRRRTLHDLPVGPLDRRRPPFVASDPETETAPWSFNTWLSNHRLETSLAATAAVALLGIFLFGGTHKPAASVSPADVSETAAITSAPLRPAARPSAGTPLASPQDAENGTSALNRDSSKTSGVANSSEPQPASQLGTNLSTASADGTSPLASPDSSLSDRSGSFPLTFTPVPSRSTSSSRSLPSARVQVSSGVMAGNLLASHPPKYPGGVAALFHTQGKVTMQAIISKSGRVENLHVLSGHFLLRNAARSAVQTWRYKPFYVNGNPVEVATIVSVEFHH